MLAGCVPSSLDTLRRDAGVKDQFSLPIPYQEAYRNLLNNARSCMSGGGAPLGGRIVDGQLYPDLNYGEVSIRVDTPTGPNIYFSADVRKDGIGSHLETYAAIKPLIVSPASVGEHFRDWASGNSGC
jgi:hypothetical protein